jgi:hypothetical protein
MHEEREGMKLGWHRKEGLIIIVIISINDSSHQLIFSFVQFWKLAIDNDGVVACRLVFL